MAMDVHWKREAIGIAAKRFRRQHGVGASLKGQRRPERPTTDGRRRKPFLPGRSRRAALEVHWNREAIGIASERFKRQHGVGASPKGQCRTLRPDDSWKAPEASLARKVSESGFGGPLEQRSHWGSVIAFQEETWSRRLSKGSASHIATIRQLEGARRHS